MAGIWKTHWRLRTKTLFFGNAGILPAGRQEACVPCVQAGSPRSHEPMFMGIVNITPDSFSDGGEFYAPEDSIQQARSLVHQGAKILDFGGESTRPGFAPVSVDEELRRIVPVLQQILQSSASRLPPVSIDTSKAAVARKAIELGVEIVNNVADPTLDEEMLRLYVESGVGICLMHSQPEPFYADVVSEVYAFLEDRKQKLIEAGVDESRIAIDPGIGFGKMAEHNIALLENIEKFHALDSPIIVGHSRKRFLKTYAPEMPPDEATHKLSMFLAAKGVQILRVHKIFPTVQKTE